MMPTSRTIHGPTGSRPPTAARRGFGMVESVFSIVLVGGLLVAALNTVGASATAQQSVNDRSIADLLARDLMTEIMVLPYEDPDGNPVFGPEPAESTPTRAGFDDVDDYRAWNGSNGAKKKLGTLIPGYAAWIRMSNVEWVNAADLTTVSLTTTNIKRVTVTVVRADEPTNVVAKLVGIRTKGPPPPSNGPIILLVVGDVEALTPQEAARVALISSWGFTVNLIDASAKQTKIDAALVDVVAAYISEQVDPTQLGSKLRDAAVGVLNEQGELTDEIGFSSNRQYVTKRQIWINDNTHYITSTFPAAVITMTTSDQAVYTLKGFGTPDALYLGYTNTGGQFYYPSLAVLNTGDSLYPSGTAAARRVQLPWGGPGFDINALDANGLTIMQRAIEWAAELDQLPVAPTPQQTQ